MMGTISIQLHPGQAPSATIHHPLVLGTAVQSVRHPSAIVVAVTTPSMSIASSAGKVLLCAGSEPNNNTSPLVVAQDQMYVYI